MQLFTVSEATSIVTADGRRIPIEFELTAAIAYTLEGSAVYDFETKGFLSGEFRPFKYRRFEDGVFRNVVRELDPQGKDTVLRKMVVIGHSQGGLLTRPTAVNSGTRFRDNGFRVPLEELDASPKTKKILQQSLFCTPMPFVRRVIFIATAHQGSFVAGGRIGKLAGKFVRLPFTLLSPIQEVFQAVSATGGQELDVESVPKSTDNMDPKSPFVRALSSMPVAPKTSAHSIIAVKNPKDPKEKWNDGVVSYGSTHLDGVVSGYIVHSAHSTQGEPATIEEIRRILLENLEEP